MSDNVIKFRRPEKNPEPPQPKKPRGPMPSWLPFAVLLAIALAIYFVSKSGMIGQ
ncbi:hypothetical protein [Devosia sp. Leaf420]|uniref:hypothetical protein n=1 Tax=Devosia sp. Leaf420 TaxID=1736374 RepID=UPI000B15A07C|nr:hypothetical protein [Devosia sp. Leaf420]